VKAPFGKRFGFTLIEITAVIFIMGLLAAAAVLSLAHTAGRARIESTRRELEQADAMVRSAARQSGHDQHLVFDLIHEEVVWQTGDDAGGVTMLQLPYNDSLTVRADDQTTDYGKVQIDFSPSGYSRTYAVKLEHDDADSPWMLVAGMTGQIVWIEHDEQLGNIFKALDTGGLDASQDSNGPVAPDGIAGPDTH
jgi:prepilin-type N-terminal cleavage/methylation domain-containing protein